MSEELAMFSVPVVPVMTLTFSTCRFCPLCPIGWTPSAPIWWEDAWKGRGNYRARRQQHRHLSVRSLCVCLCACTWHRKTVVFWLVWFGFAFREILGVDLSHHGMGMVTPSSALTCGCGGTPNAVFGQGKKVVNQKNVAMCHLEDTLQKM